MLEASDRIGHFKLRSATDLDEPALASFVGESVRLNREKGSPAARG